MLKAQTQTSAIPIRVAIVERYALVRAALREMLEHDRDVQIVGEEPSVPIVLSTLRRDPADVVVVHAGGNSETDLAALQRIRREWPNSAVIVLGRQRSDSEVFWAIQAGAAAHLDDAAHGADLVRTIRAVAAGEYLIDAEVAARPVVARRVLDAFREASFAAEVLDGDPSRRAFTRLSNREVEILTAISEGLSNKEMAVRFSISQHTVNNTVKAVLRKLAVNNRTKAVLIALRESWIPIPEFHHPVEPH
jgi:DNA-binding NarL/FixJ family response regulator